MPLDKDFDAMKKIKKCLIFLLLALCIVASSIVIAHRYIGVCNPVSTLVGLLDVLIFDNDYKKIQSEPQVVIANKHFDIEKYMECVPYESEFEGVYDINGQTIYYFNVGEGQEIIEQVEKTDFMIWKWR